MELLMKLMDNGIAIGGFVYLLYYVIGFNKKMYNDFKSQSEAFILAYNEVTAELKHTNERTEHLENKIENLEKKLGV
jgi:hypothetical protein